MPATPQTVSLESSHLTRRDKMAIVEATARVAVTMLLAMLAFCELLIATGG